VGFWGMLAYWLGKGVMYYVDELHQYMPELAAISAVLIAGGLFLLWRRYGNKEK
jgi:hypothetical protein